VCFVSDFLRALPVASKGECSILGRLVFAFFTVALEVFANLSYEDAEVNDGVKGSTLIVVIVTVINRGDDCQ
jgi:hypothetical protein